MCCRTRSSTPTPTSTSCDELSKLESALTNIIGIVEQLQKSNHFQVTTMPVMKDERELISEEAYSEFWKSNELVINQNFERNAYLALLMQELEEDRRLDKRRWDADEERLLNTLYESGENYQTILARFPDRSEREIRKKIYYLNRRKQQE